MSHHDAIVVGVGLAGLTAAARLAEGGARVLVLAKGVGATHLGPCTIDVIGYAPERVERPGEALAGLGDGHPYAAVGRDGVQAALDWFKGVMAPYPYVGGLEENLLLPTAVGALKPSAAVPGTMAAGDLREGGEVCVVGFRALKDFHATLLADNLARAGIPARAVELDLVPEGRADVNSLGFARAFDAPAFRSEVAAHLTARLGRDERLAFPAVLGIAGPTAAWSELRDRLARPVFEVPTLPPSVPGMRVFAILRERLRRAGARVILNAVVHDAERSGGRVTGVQARVGLRDVRHGADWVVLATGGFASGGLELDSRWRAREVALGLPVSGAPGPGEERFRAGYFDDHPMGRAGVRVGRDLRPEGLDNVLVAGATLAGAQPWREKSGDGISLSTGHRAAELILGQRAAAPPTEPAKAEA
ncbi:MAG TPA: anaerobic glycerol-3-phosphate dehydrogenase subunit GlpB [Solirubrobacteraceae bacterium]|jgi:glycerol-3-phosphate dehydrogenase subunit B|nr:anaerobic glycerol-3-phosphate dehydrogenase subunit GlpB [Solirubrobacteraceae bacterium]